MVLYIYMADYHSHMLLSSASHTYIEVAFHLASHRAKPRDQSRFVPAPARHRGQIKIAPSSQNLAARAACGASFCQVQTTGWLLGHKNGRLYGDLDKMKIRKP